MTLSLELGAWFCFRHSMFAVATKYTASIMDQNVYEISGWAGLTRVTKARSRFTGCVSLYSGIRRDDKDLVFGTNLGGRIAHESDSVDVASESGRQTHPI
jgi:hypothetical protein